MAACGTPPAASGTTDPVTLLNVSYDPTREFYREFNTEFAHYWKGKTGDDVTVRQSHGGAGDRRGRSSMGSMRTW